MPSSTSYPTSCGTNGAIVDISLACLNDLWKSDTCTTTFASTNDPKSFTLVGGPPNLLPFSTYGQALSLVNADVNNAAAYPILCNKDTYIHPGANDSNVDIINGYNAELNGLTAQYTLLYNKYIGLLKNVPLNNSGAIVKTDAIDSAIENIKMDLIPLYQNILKIANTINSSIKKVGPEGVTIDAAIQTNAANLVNKIQVMNSEFNKLNVFNKTNDPNELEGNYEESKIKTTSSFIRNMLYILFALFVIGCLVMININPTESKLDMFILALGVIILVYYIYMGVNPQTPT